MKKIRLGFVGVGWIAEKSHIPAFLEIKEVDIIAIFDVAKDNLERVADQFCIKHRYTNYRAFLESGLDAVVVAAPNYTHGFYSIMALNSGIHVLCEKPITIHEDEIYKVARLAKENNLVFMPAFVNRFRSDVKELLGKIHQVGTISSIKAGWLREEGVPKPGSWFTHKKYSGGGVLADLGPHVIDICLNMISDHDMRDLRKLKAYMSSSVIDLSKKAKWFGVKLSENLIPDVEDSFKGVCEINQCRLMLLLSWNSGQKGDCTFFDVRGDRGKLLLKTLFGYSENSMWGSSTLQFSGTNGQKENFYLESGKTEQDRAFRRLANEYINQIHKKDQITSFLDDARDNVCLINQFYQVAESGGEAIRKGDMIE